MDISKQQGQYQYQKKSPLPLQNVTQQYQNASRNKENDESPISASGNHSFSTSNKQKSDSNQQQKQNLVISSQEIVSKYSIYLQSTRSTSRASASTTKRIPNLNTDNIQDEFQSKKLNFTQTSPIGVQSISSNSKSPVRSLLGETALLERTKSEDKISSNKSILQSSKSTVALSQHQDFKIEHESNNSTNEFKLQLIRKLGELEIELKKENIKNQNLEYDNKNLRSTIHKLQEQFKSQSKDNLDLRKTVDSLNKEIAEYIKLQQEEQQIGLQEKKLQQIFEKTEIEQKLSKECDRLSEIIEEKENQINKWMERFMNLKESKLKETNQQKDLQAEKQLITLKEQVSSERNEMKQIKQQNKHLQIQVEELTKEKDNLKLNNQMLQEQIKQNSQIIHSQQNKLQELDGQNKSNDKNKKNYEQRLEEIQMMNEDLEQKILELEQGSEDLAYKNREMMNQLQKNEKQILIQKQKYEERISEYQSVLQDLRKQIDDLNLSNLDLKTTLKIKSDEENSCKDQVRNLKEQVKKLSDDLNEKNEKLIQYSKKESSEKFKQLGFTQSAEIENLRLKTRLQELEQELQVQRCDYDRLISNISQMQKQNDDLINQVQNQERAHKIQLDELEKNCQQLTQSQVEREVKKQNSENERNKLIQENQSKMMEKQIQSSKERIQELEIEMQNQQAAYKKQLDQIKEEKSNELKEVLNQYENQLKEKRMVIEDQQKQIKTFSEVQVQSKEKEESSKALQQQIVDLRKQIEILHLDSRNKQTIQKEQEKKLHDKIQEAIQKFNRDLRLKDQDIQFFEKENEDLNRIITQQKMTINQLQNRVQKNISSQNEEELLKQLGLNELITEKNKEEEQIKEQQQNDQRNKALFSSFTYTHSNKDDKSMNRQLSQPKIANVPIFRDEQKLTTQSNIQNSKKHLFDGVVTSDNLPVSGSWNYIQDIPMSDTDWKIEKHELSNWSQDDQIMEKLQDQQQISFSLQQQCFQREQNEGSEVQSDVEEFHIPLYSNNN